MNNEIFYHGTNRTFNDFEIPKTSQNLKCQLGLLGIFFTKCPKLASDFTKVWWTNEKSKYKKGANVRPVKLNIKNPLKLNNTQFLLFSGKSDKDIINFREQIISEGYDSIIFLKPNLKEKNCPTILKEFITEQYVVFSNDNIKSIFEN